MTSGQEAPTEYSAYMHGDSVLVVMAIDTTATPYDLRIKLPVKVTAGTHVLSTGNETDKLCQESPIEISEATNEVMVSMPGRSLTECLAVGSGFGYYSLSSILITQYNGPELGTVALLANIIREIFTLLGAPLLVKFFGPLAPISCGGATTMDTTLPIITRYSGENFVLISLFHGFLVDFSVPFLVTFFCTL